MDMDNKQLLRQLGSQLLSQLLRDPLVPFYGAAAMVSAFLIKFLGSWLIWLSVQVLFFGGLAICVFGLGRWIGYFGFKAANKVRNNFNKRV
jgi:fatty-acid desaturase